MNADATQGHLHWTSVSEASHAIAAGDLSPVELMQAHLDRIARLDPRLNAFIQLDGDAALAAARVAEAEASAGRLRGPLHGIPVGIKTSSMSPACPRPATPRCCRTISPSPTRCA